ncbi:MAG: hypothetical protein ABIS67_00410 [Candidatus Eisenbacteria bacterium]
MHASPGGWHAAAGSDAAANRFESPGSRTLTRLGFAAWACALYYLWFDVTRSQLSDAFGSEASSRGVAGAALATVATRVVSQLLEAGFYVLLWRLLARPIRFGPMFVAVLSLSSLDLFSSVVLRLVGTDPPQVWLALLTGFQAMPSLGHAESGLRLAFGGLGLFAIARIAGTAYAQRREGIPWRAALALTFAVSLAGRVAIWWTADLVRGASPLP